MSHRSEDALTFLHHQIEDLKQVQEQAMNTTNAISEKDKFLKWKKRTVALVSEKVGAAYAKHLENDWIDATFISGDIYEELYDDIDMCLRHLKKMVKDIESRGLQDSLSSE